MGILKWIGAILFITPLLMLFTWLVCNAFDIGEEFTRLCLFPFKTRANKDLAPCLTFSQFLSFYNLAPEHWSLYCDYVVCKEIGCGFNFTTYGELYKYGKWKKKYDREIYQNKALKDLNKVMTSLTGYVKEEIERNNAEAEAKAREVYEEVRKRCE